jgi:hypothetical protein
MDKLLSDEQAAALITKRARPTTPRTVQRWRLEGLLPYVRIGPKTPRIRQSAVEAFLQADVQQESA